jgi:hypothetical protein
MNWSDLFFALLAANPIGGLVVAIPYAVLKLHYPLWLAVVVGVPLAYLQVVVVDFAWNLLGRAPAWRRLIERRRSPRVERLLASRGGFWITFLSTPVLGPWLVMAFMRYAQVAQRRVALPILAALACTAVAMAAASAVVPHAFAAGR